ncbi:hypothetical protein MASSI9I_60094 [Massilia sp. 9I]|nr:hypothetical protein MASSI9I_60094 [Massilia sp. 9I]
MVTAPRPTRQHSGMGDGAGPEISAASLGRGRTPLILLIQGSLGRLQKVRTTCPDFFMALCRNRV